MKRTIGIVISVILCFSLCGCSLFSGPSELLKAPRLAGEMYAVEQALKSSISDSYTLEYPSAGEKRSSVVLEDIDDDGRKEAFAFYSTSDKEEKQMHLNLLVRDNKEYKSVFDFSVTAAGIEKIEFCDFNIDGNKEIAVGFQIYGQDEKNLVAFKYNSGRLMELARIEYTSFLCEDLMNNGQKQLFVQKLTKKSSENIASLYALNDKTFSKLSDCSLDGGVSSVSKIVFSALSNGDPAVYIDEVKGVGAITEILFVSKGKLINPLLSTADQTIRSAGIPFCDVNGDSVLEIPVADPDPVAAAAGINLINWCSFNGEKMTPKQTAFVNVVDGYSISVPPRLNGKLKMTKNSEKRIRTVYYYDAASESPEKKLFTVRVISSDDSVANKEGEVIASKNGESFIVEITKDATDLKITKEELKSMFSFNEF